MVQIIFEEMDDTPDYFQNAYKLWIIIKGVDKNKDNY